MGGLVGGASGGKGRGIFGLLDPLNLFNLGSSEEAEPAKEAPKVEAAPVMPLPDDAAVQAAKKRSIAQQLQRRGRDSTIMSNTDSGDTLG